MFPLLHFIKIKQSYQHSNAPKTNHTTNHLSYARKTSCCRHTINQIRSSTQSAMKGISCVVTPCSAALAHTHRAVSNEVVLKLEASALTWCSAPNNQPYWNHLPLQDVHTRKHFSEWVGELTGFKTPAMKWVSHKQQGQGRINEKKKIILFSFIACWGLFPSTVK